MMNSKNSLILGRGIFLILIIVVFGLIIVNEKKEDILKGRAEEKINDHLKENYSTLSANIGKMSYQNNTFTKKISSPKNKNLYFYISYKDKKVTDTYQKDYIEGESLLTYLKEQAEKEIQKKTKIDCKIYPVRKLNEYSKQVQEKLIKEENLLELKYYYLEKELLIKDWSSKEITKEITELIETTQENKITPKYYEVIIINEQEVTTSIRIQLTETFLEEQEKGKIIDSILKKEENPLLEKYEITYQYEN